MRFVPAPGHVEIEPLKDEGIIIDPNKKYEEMGRVVAFPEGVEAFVIPKTSETWTGNFVINLGDTIFFDSYACRATAEIEGKKHYVVNITDGGLLGVIHVEKK